MDCGPAALASLLNGCGIDVSYPRLREACQTDVDGTSIDTLEELAVRFGLDAEQVMLPVDVLLEPDNGHLPCIAVVTLPNGLTHFVVIWRRVLGWYEVMDPARGRSWMRRSDLESALYVHETPVAATDWLEYAQSEGFEGTLSRALGRLAVSDTKRQGILSRIRDADWRSAANVDAAIRMCLELRTGGERVRGRIAERLIELAASDPGIVPAPCYQVASSGNPTTVRLRGAVVLTANGRVQNPSEDDLVIAKALGGFRVPVGKRLVGILREIGFAGFGVRIGIMALVMGALTFIEALVFRYLLGFQPPIEFSTFALILIAVMLPSTAALVAEFGQSRFSLALGRHLEVQLRARLLRKLPRIRDDYFSSRLASDLAHRGHALSELRTAPTVIAGLAVNVSRIVMMLAGLVWLMPSAFWIVLIAGAFATVAPFGMFRMLAERDIRARTHLGALSNLYLDGLRGTEPIWAHGAARAIELEHESLLIRWVRATNRLRNVSTWFEFMQVVALGACGIALVVGAMNDGLPQGSVLLIAYWALFVPILSRMLLGNLKQLPSMHNILLRVLEVLDAPEEHAGVQPTHASGVQGGVKLGFKQLVVSRGNQRVLADIDLTIDAGERVAIVGASGSGKSSFIGAIAGWHVISGGVLEIDDAAADATLIQQLRQQTALVDPESYLWNRELYANVLYGTAGDPAALDSVLRDSELLADLEKMVDGLATRVGENGSRLSGGEGQRLRIARALVRSDARLVLLDEPFAAMDSEQRRRMHDRVLARWPQATLLCVSHQVSETIGFSRVLVFEDGRIVEDDSPQSLLGGPTRYASMVQSEVELQRRLLASPWRAWSATRQAANPT